MAKDHRTQNFVVGIVFLGGLALLGMATLQIRGGFMADTYAISVRFPRVDNLREGEDVLLFGKGIGVVSTIDIDPERDDVRVECQIDSRIRLTEGTQFRIRSAGPLGGRYLEIFKNRTGRPVDDGREFQGRTDGDLFEEIGHLVRETRHGEGLLPRLIQDEELAQKVEQTVEEIRATFRRFNSDEGPLSAFTEMRSTFNTINTGEGPMSAFINDRDMRDKLISTVDNLSSVLGDVRESKGIAGMLITDEAAKDDLKTTLSQIRVWVEDLRRSEGLLPRLIKDEELSGVVGDMLTDGHEVLHKVNTGDGSLGQLVNNREAWDEIMRILIIARESIEDLREQAPINTFANVIFAVF